MSRRGLAVLTLLILAASGLFVFYVSARDESPPIARAEDAPASLSKPDGPTPDAKARPAPDEKTPEVVTPEDHPQAPNAEDRLPPMPGATPTPSTSTKDSVPDQPPLPEPVQRMREAIVEAARTGNIDEMQPVLEMSELKPMTGSGPGEKAIEYWKKTSADGAGRELLATMLNVFESSYARVEGKGGPDIYVWPGFSERPLSSLTPAEEVELYRIVPGDKATEMKKAGKYTSYRAGVGADGTWHYFVLAK